MCAQITENMLKILIKLEHMDIVIRCLLQDIVRCQGEAVVARENGQLLREEHM